MKSSRIFLSILIFSALTSCGKKEEGGNLEISVKPDTSFILPGKRDAPCYENDVNGPRLFYSGMDITWKGDDEFYPAIIKLTYKSPEFNGEYSCTFEEEITGFFADANNVQVATNFFVKGTYKLYSQCAIECGGISMRDATKPFKASGELKLIGYSIDDDGNQVPYSVRATVFLQNID